MTKVSYRRKQYWNEPTLSLWEQAYLPEILRGLGITFVARSGRPYSLTFRGGGVFNDSVSGNDNALAYIPTGTSDVNISPSSNMQAVADLAEAGGGLDLVEPSSGIIWGGLGRGEGPAARAGDRPWGRGACCRDRIRGCPPR